MSHHTVLVVLGALLLSSCGVLAPHKAPTVARGHVGQVMAASSLVAEGQSLLEHASNMVQRVSSINNNVKREAETQNFLDAKRLMFDMLEVIEPRDNAPQSRQPGLRETVELAREHTQLAVNASGASEAITRFAPDIRRRAGKLLEQITTLTTYINIGLNVNSLESLVIISDEIESTASLLSGELAVEDGYSLRGYQTDLELMLASGDEQFVDEDMWYLKNFENAPASSQWRFKKKPQVQRRDLLNSDNDGSLGSSGGGDDDDDDDDDDD